MDVKTRQNVGSLCFAAALLLVGLVVRLSSNEHGDPAAVIGSVAMVIAALVAVLSLVSIGRTLSR